MGWVLGLGKEVLQEAAVLALADAITDRAGIARHQEVLAKGGGELSAGALGQGQDPAVVIADLIRAQGLKAWIHRGVGIGAARGRLRRKRLVLLVWSSQVSRR